MSGTVSGPNPTANCTVCQAPTLGYIDATIIAGGTTLKDIARATGVSYAALRRHAANHVAVAAPSGGSSSSVPLPAGSSPLDHMRRTLDRMGATDISSLPLRQQAAFAESLRRVAAEVARMEPVGGDAIEVRVADVPGLAEFFAELIIVMDDYPQLRSRFEELFRKHGLIPTSSESADEPTEEVA